MCEGICSDCILNTENGCCSQGSPEEIEGYVISCSYYLRKGSNKPYNKGFIDGFIFACIKHDEILDKYKKIVKEKDNDLDRHEREYT